MGNLGSGTGSSYPGNLDVQTTPEVNSPNANKTKARAEVPNDIIAATLAIETTLGTNPQGLAADVKSFLQKEHNQDGTHGNITATTISVSSSARIVNLTADHLWDGVAARNASSTPAPNTIPVSEPSGYIATGFLGSGTATAGKFLRGDQVWINPNVQVQFTYYVPLTCTISHASPAVVTTGSPHGLPPGRPIVFTTTGTLPSPLVIYKVYYVIAAGLGTYTFRISDTLNGSAINTTTDGSGTHSERITDIYTFPSGIVRVWGFYRGGGAGGTPGSNSGSGAGGGAGYPMRAYPIDVTTSTVMFAVIGSGGAYLTAGSPTYLGVSGVGLSLIAGGGQVGTLGSTGGLTGSLTGPYVGAHGNVQYDPYDEPFFNQFAAISGAPSGGDGIAGAGTEGANGGGPGGGVGGYLGSVNGQNASDGTGSGGGGGYGVTGPTLGGSGSYGYAYLLYS